MPFIDLNKSTEKELIPGFQAKLIHTDGLTVGYFRIKAGSILPEHHHVHEQISNVLDGEFEMTIDGHTQMLRPGMVAVIPSMAIHSGKAVTDCYILDVFNPVREDYK
jgi:quercetin dioxygenase-like cupin family protein